MPTPTKDVEGLVERLRDEADLIDAGMSMDDGPPMEAMRDAADLIRSLQAEIEELKREAQELAEIGERDGYERAVQDIDLMTGGDGEYRFCTDGDPERHTPDAATMKARIVERLQSSEAQTNTLVEAATELADAVFGRQTGDEPDVYADYDRLSALERKTRSALSAISKGRECKDNSSRSQPCADAGTHIPRSPDIQHTDGEE